MEFETPGWVQDAVFYQIFPERFANGDPMNDPPGSVAWGSMPTNDCTMGGDLQGVIDRLDYLQDLGVTAIYFNPVFKARSNHKFDHGDYMQIDPHFGTNDLFKRFVDDAHHRGIRIILDISQNHSGREFFAFDDVVKEGEESRYRGWYHFQSFPVSEADNPNYKSWWGIGTLPEFNTDNPEVRDYFNKVTRYWMEEMGIDGWRLDVANEVSHEYWAEWRQLVKSINPEAYTVGEIWGDGSPWLQGDNFDAVMNYVWRDAVLHYFIERKTSSTGFHDSIQNLLRRHPDCVNRVMFNLLGSHDTPRVLTEAGGNVKRVRLAMIFQMTYVGAPVIYYGDEIGMEGGKDPDCRRAFPWDESEWDTDFHRDVKDLIKIRAQIPALRSLQYERIDPMGTSSEGIYVYRRGKGDGSHIVALNNTDEAHDVTIAVDEIHASSGNVTDRLAGKSYEMSDGIVRINLLPNDGVILGRQS